MFDFHVHTNYTMDAQGTVEKYCKYAVKLGVTELCFTNHQEWFSVVDGKFDFALTDAEWKNCMEDIKKARMKFPGLKIRFGVELGYSPKWTEEIIEFSKKYPFDYVIGSVHYVKDFLLAGPTEKRWEGADKYRHYFKKLKKAIELGIFDCIGHFDIVKKYSELVSHNEFKDLVLDCISAMKKHDVGFELNAQGWKHQNKQQYPSIEILKQMHEEGIKKVTYGSDTHIPEGLCYNFEKSMTLLRSVGFEEICTFSDRKPTYHKL